MEIPFISQHADIADPLWQWRGCGVTALAMVLAYWHAVDPKNKIVPVEELLSMGQAAKAFREGIGWTHKGLVDIARQCGYTASNFDYAPQSPTPKSMEEAWQTVVQELENGPIMASVYKDLDSTQGGGHIVVISEIIGDEVLFNDPKLQNEKEGRRRLPVKDFISGFKQRYILVRP